MFIVIAIISSARHSSGCMYGVITDHFTITLLQATNGMRSLFLTNFTTNTAAINIVGVDNE